MKDKQFKKLFKEEFNKQYNINLTTKDVFQPNDFKTKRFNINNYWKYSSICSTCLLIISLVFIGYLLKFQIDLGYGASTFQTIYFTEDNNILTNEELDEIAVICDGGFKNKEAQYLVIDKDVTMYVYNGKMYVDVNGKLESQYVYIYVFDFQNNNRNIILNVGDSEYVVNKDNRYGILSSIDEDEKQEIIFTLTYYGDSDKYLYKGE